MPPPFLAPLPLLVIIDLDDGARLMVQGTPDDAPSIAIGDRRVTLSLRRYALERGVPVYGFKARSRRQEVGQVAVQGGWHMSWNKVAVVGAGMIKFGELFEQSYEQMAAGRLLGRGRERRQGIRPSGRSTPASSPPSGAACGARRASAATPSPSAIGLVRGAVHPGGERLPVGFRRVPHRRDGGRDRACTTWSS